MSIELDPVSFMDCQKVGLEDYVPSAVILQVFPQTTPVEVTEEEITAIISDDRCVDCEEEVVAVEVNTVSKLKDIFISSKGFDNSETLNVTEELCM